MNDIVNMYFLIKNHNLFGEEAILYVASSTTRASAIQRAYAEEEVGRLEKFFDGSADGRFCVKVQDSSIQVDVKSDLPPVHVVQEYANGRGRRVWQTYVVVVVDVANQHSVVNSSKMTL